MKIFPDATSPEGTQIYQDHPTLPVDVPLVRTLIDTILRGEQREAASLNVILTHREVIRALNEKWLGHQFDTDVLSFSLSNTDPLEGEVYVSLDYAHEHCVRFGATFLQETCRYVAHGLLHLLGYDDAASADRMTMRRLEDSYLQLSGILPARRIT